MVSFAKKKKGGLVLPSGVGTPLASACGEDQTSQARFYVPKPKEISSLRKEMVQLLQLSASSCYINFLISILNSLF